MAHHFNTSYVDDSRNLLRYYKRLCERAIEQCPDDDLFLAPDPESNSIAIVVKHLAGNMRSRWTDFLISDGEKPDRNRDNEFEDAPKTRKELLEMWETGWKCVFSALEPLTDADVARAVTIRTELHSVMQAINRQVAHYAYHVGQIVYLAKHYAAANAANWEALTIPRGKSKAFAADVAAGRKTQSWKELPK